MSGNNFEFATKGHDEWLTPPDMIDALGPFDLDPCSPIVPPWRTASRMLNVNDDGLNCDWDGFVWLNPPYGKETFKWMAKLGAHGGGGIALIYARTETRGFFDTVWNSESAKAILFLKGRVAFHYVDGSKSKPAGAPSVLVAYGKQGLERMDERFNISPILSGKLIKIRP